MCLRVSSKTVGIIGGGQLGMMLAEAVKKLGGKVIALDPSVDASVTHVCDEFINASFDDLEALEELCKKSDVITYEFENVKSEYLNDLARKYNIKQGLAPLFDSQDRLREKENALKHGLLPVRFFAVSSKEDLLKGVKELGYPCIYKTRTLGYDGHGQVLIKKPSDLEKVTSYLKGSGILEEYLNFDYEVSVIMVRNQNKCVALPLNRNMHKNGILDITYLPSGVSKELEERIIKASKIFMESANYLGILCIEYFVKGDRFYFNEMAPRPHNSGHYSIEGCNYSQYDLFARFLLDLDLPEISLKTSIVMKNILGESLYMVDKLKELPNAHVHMYYKKEARPKRKMGHITFTDMTYDEYKKIEENM